MARVGKQRIAEHLSSQSGLSRSAAMRAVGQVFQGIVEELARGNSVCIPGFGTWKSKVHAPRMGRNPQDGKELVIPARNRVHFKAGAKLHQRVEVSLEPEIYFGEGVATGTQIEALLAHVFGMDPSTFHLEEAVKRIAEVLAPETAEEAADFFETLRAKVDGYPELATAGLGSTRIESCAPTFGEDCED